MSHPRSERLYNLLPAIHRLRDVEQGEALRALLAVIEKELVALESDITGLYENWFVETCEEWVVPYIGDLLGVRCLHSFTAGAYSQRARVANTISYRRRKGTVAMLEQLTRDTTNWPARVVEFFKLLLLTQNLNHLQPGTCTINLRDMTKLELLGGPFETAAHTVDVRRIGSGGKYNIPNIGLFAWRLQSYAVNRGTAHAVTEPADGRYTFSPLGFDIPLFNRPQVETEFTHMAEETNVPATLRRRALYEELEARRQAIVDDRPLTALYFGVDSALQVFIDDDATPIPPEQILICDLSDPPTPIPEGWRRPPTTKVYQAKTGPKPMPIKVAVDPALGRLALPVGVTPSKVEVSYSYGFSGDLGGGPYDRQESLSRGLTRPITWQVGVSAGFDTDDEVKGLYKSLSKAVAKWNQQPAGTVGAIAILDSRTYKEDLTADDKITIPENSQLLVVAAGWPKSDLHVSPGTTTREVGQLSPTGLRPHLLGDISVTGTAIQNETPGRLVIDGVLIEGRLSVLVGNLGSLRLAHCTLAPDKGGVTVNSSMNPELQNTQLQITIDHSICGPLSLPESVQKLDVADSIIDHGSAVSAVSAPGTEARIVNSTIFGRIVRESQQAGLRSLDAENSVFTDLVKVMRRQLGCVRFCFVPNGSLTPRRYRCQPDLALKDVADPGEQACILARVKPSFTSTHYGHPGYAQLSRSCPSEIRTGAEDGSEMGAFSFLKQPQREANLRSQLDEYLPFGLEANLFHVT